MIGPAIRFGAAALLAAVLGVYSVLFGRATYLLDDTPLGLDWIEWLPVLGFLGAAAAAVLRRHKTGSALVVVGMIGFLIAQYRYVLTVPLATVVITAGSLLYLLLMPTSDRR